MPTPQALPLVKRQYRRLFLELRSRIAGMRVPEPERGNMRVSATERDRHRTLARSAGLTTPQFHSFLLDLYESTLEEQSSAPSNSMGLSHSAIAS